MSFSIIERARKVIPAGVNSPVRSRAPFIAASGKGAVLTDADGRNYIDYCCSWGALLLGHAHPTIVKAASEQIAQGSTFGIATEIEEKIATLVTFLMPNVEKLRFVSSGTEATMTALRLARAFTNRSKIIKFAGHYHGHSDALLIRAGSGAEYLNAVATSKGVPAAVIADTICLPFNDFAAAREFFASPLALQTAALILEPITANMGVVLPAEGFLEFLREETAKKGIVLIFDEVVTGFRVGLQGAQGLFNIRPDLTCLGKIVGGGFPAAAVGGRREILDQLAPLGEVYQAGTLSGNPVAMRAGYETLQIATQPGFYNALQQKMDRFIAKCPLPIRRVGTMFQPQVADFEPFFQYLLERGVYIPPHPNEAWFLSTAHTDEQMDKTCAIISSYAASLPELPACALPGATLR